MWFGPMIISERLLFKGLSDELPKTTHDRLFDRGHAFAVSMIGVCVALVAVGLTLLS